MIKNSVNENRTSYEQTKRPRQTHELLSTGFGSNFVASSSNNNHFLNSLIHPQISETSHTDILSTLDPIVLNQRTEEQRTEDLFRFIQYDLPNIQNEQATNNTNTIQNTATNNNNKKREIKNNDNKNGIIKASANKEMKNNDDDDSSQSPRCPICLENLQEVIHFL